MKNNMNFPRTISLLRKEKNLSQRKVARELGVSQAVLSHYENGLREPGLEFVARIADYYKVSADFLLGRTMSREDYTITAEDLPDSSEDKDNVLRGSMMATLAKKLVINSMSVIFDIVGKSKNKNLITETAAFFNLAVYKVFRSLYSANKESNEDIFSVDERIWSELTNAELSYSALNIKREAEGMTDAKDKKTELPALSQEYISAEYPALSPSLLSVLQSVGKRLGDRIDK
ncbi:MAG: helix-turn-helix transcriptional regulator [Oscillospiraceae bacterium]|nr:helix-turn-helix transcriptional regulator [Oscillospiraceae bacterium]